jgi:hypothetical protein
MSLAVFKDFELSPLDVTALRKADDVTLHFFEDRHFIRAHKRVSVAERSRDPFAQDQVYEIKADPLSHIISYEKGERGGGADVRSCYANVTLHTRSIWRNVLKVDDRLVIEWVRGNYSETTRASGLAVDEVSIMILRGRGDKCKEIKFLAEVSVTEKNSARMTRSAAEAG